MAAITAAAIELIDRDGLDRLSMRRLGTELGYEAMALYKHVADKSALLDAVVEQVYAEMTTPDPAIAWQDRIRTSAWELRRVAQLHPHLFIRMVTEPPATPAVLERIDAILAALRDSGADDASVVHHFFLFVNMTSGALLAETNDLTAGDEPAIFDGDPADGAAECRALAHFGERLAQCDFDAEYERIVDVFLAVVAD